MFKVFQKIIIGIVFIPIGLIAILSAFISRSAEEVFGLILLLFCFIVMQISIFFSRIGVDRLFLVRITEKCLEVIIISFLLIAKVIPLIMRLIQILVSVVSVTIIFNISKSVIEKMALVFGIRLAELDLPLEIQQLTIIAIPILMGVIAGITSTIANSLVMNRKQSQKLNLDKSNSNSIYSKFFFIFIENYLQKIAPETWNKTCDAFLDTIEAFPDEINRWEKQNLKYVAYLVLAWDLLGFFRYFMATAISTAIATRRVSS